MPRIKDIDIVNGWREKLKDLELNQNAAEIKRGFALVTKEIQKNHKEEMTLLKNLLQRVEELEEVVDETIFGEDGYDGYEYEAEETEKVIEEKLPKYIM